MYLIKDLKHIATGEETQTPVPVQFRDYHKVFNFLDWINPSKRQEFKCVLTEEPSFVADIAASVIAQLQEAGLLREDCIQKALECCHLVLIARGYESTYPHHLLHEGDDHTNNVMLIAGCQSRPLLKARVKKAFELWQRLQKGFTFVFSGRNPSKRQVGRKLRILNEAREMENYFYSLLEQPNVNQLTYTARRIDLDEESYSTATNIKEFLDGDFLSRKKVNHVYIVSSSFHLIRLAQTLESAIQPRENGPQIDKVILVGAEDPDIASNVAHLPNYVKSMMHDVFEFLLDESMKTNAYYNWEQH